MYADIIASRDQVISMGSRYLEETMNYWKGGRKTCNRSTWSSISDIILRFWKELLCRNDGKSYMRKSFVDLSPVRSVGTGDYIRGVLEESGRFWEGRATNML
ncbi:MAG: hypothetical protein LC133_06880 [Bacteroidales bacterium]|nr:hypothetical protein [Bacteroidales bacterium]